MDYYTFIRKTTRRTPLIGREGHDTQSSWNRLYDYYYLPMVKDMQSKGWGWSDLAPDAFEEAVLRIRRDKGLFIRSGKYRFHQILRKRCRQALALLGRKRDRERERHDEAVEILQALSAPDSAAKRAVEAYALRIAHALLSGSYKRTPLAEFFPKEDERKVILWRHASRDGATLESTRAETGAAISSIHDARKYVCGKIRRLALETLAEEIV